MTPLDMQPFGIAWCLKAIGSGALFVSPFLLAALIERVGHFHRRGLARLRAHQQKGTTR